MPTDWITSYGLREDPFAETGTEGPFFVTPQLNQRVNLLLHLVQYSDLMLVVTGSRGSGKTTLIGRLLGDAGPRWRSCLIESDPEMDPGGLLDGVVAGFDLPRGGNPLSGLETYLQGLRKATMRPVLVVDDAHLLPAASLDQLARLAADRKRLGLAIVLFGEPPLLERVSRGSGAGLVHVIDVPALSEGQIADYLELRLGRAGMKGRSPFNDAAVHALYKTSRGMPGLVNQAAAQFLANRGQAAGDGLAGALRTAGRAVARHQGITATAAGVILVVAVAGAALWLAGGDEPPPAPTTTIQLRQPQPATTGVPATRQRESRPPLVPPPSATYPPVSPDAARTVAPQPPSPLPDPPRPPPSPGETLAPSRAPAAPAVAGEADKAAPQMEPAAAAGKAAPAGEPAPTATPAELPRSSDESWLLGQPTAHYTVQLFGSHDRQAAERFRGAHKLKERLATYRTGRDGKDWYVVVMGSYPTRDGAQRSIQSLPPEIKRNNPWPRSLASVQDSIRQAPRRN